MTKIIKIITLALVLLIPVGHLKAIEPQYEISPNWHMLTCAGFGYRLSFDNSNQTFKLTYGDECPSVIRSVYKGNFKIEPDSLVVDFGDFKAHYYIKNSYSPICDNQKDNLTEQELKLVCDKSQLDSATEFIPQEKPHPKYFAAKTMLFPSRIEGVLKGEKAERLVKDLKTHPFILDN